MNTLVAIFYSNYKNNFTKIIPLLKNQNDLVNIVKVSTKECGNLSLTRVYALLEKFYFGSKAGFEKQMSQFIFQNKKRAIKELLVKRAAIKRKQED